MTNRTDTDTYRTHGKAQPALPFAEEELSTNGPRLRPAELARLLGVSRQTVSEWLKAGKTRLGADGRIDPRKAVADVLRTSDPARLRARVLAPLVEEVAALRARVAHLAHELAECEEDRQFHAGAEMVEQLTALESLVKTLPGITDESRAALKAELDRYGGEPLAGSPDVVPGELAGLPHTVDSFEVAKAEAWLDDGSADGAAQGR